MTLKTCPFCNSEVELEGFGYYHLGDETHQIACKNIQCKIRPIIIRDQHEDYFDIEEEWNTRYV